MYVVAAALPPILPTTFTVSVGVSNARLANKRIACANSASILVAGKVTRAFFDKTGTLTTQGLDFKSARSANDWTSETISDDMNMAKASCHAATLSSAGLLVGNPVDCAMFTACGATSDASRGTSVITDCNGNELEVTRVKGSGESISKICTYGSLPSDFDSSVRKSAAAGIYQIAVAMKQLDAGSAATISRDDVEKDCAFVGVLNFLNTLTPDVVRQLAAGAIESTVVTGDNTMNGIRAAREAGIITANIPVIIGNVRHHDSESIAWTDESGNDVGTPSSDDLERNKIQLAMSGKAWSALRINDPKVAIHIAPYVRVFGRCTPYDKVSVVDTFVKLGFITMMCGDGGNDCGALKAAHVGIALSDAEASMVSPFTSLDHAITSCVDVLREGRCALASALAVCKFIIMYGLVTVMNQMITAYFKTTFGDWNWVFTDGVWVICLAYTLPLARSAKTLAKTRPTASILGPLTVLSAGGIIAIHFIFTAIALVVLFNQDFFECRKWIPTNVLNALVLGDNYESLRVCLHEFVCMLR